jgi:hypothetical protein
MWKEKANEAKESTLKEQQKQSWQLPKKIRSFERQSPVKEKHTVRKEAATKEKQLPKTRVKTLLKSKQTTKWKAENANEKSNS